MAAALRFARDSSRHWDSKANENALWILPYAVPGDGRGLFGCQARNFFDETAATCQFDLERTRPRYTGQDIATMIAAYAAVWISATAWNTEIINQPTRHEYVLQG